MDIVDKLSCISACGIVHYFSEGFFSQGWQYKLSTFQLISFNLEIAKKRFKCRTPLLHPIRDLERPLENIFKKDKCRTIKYHNIHGTPESESYVINLPIYRRGTPEEQLAWKDKLLKALVSQRINTGPQRYICTERLLTGNTKATLNQAAHDIGVLTFQIFNNAPLKMTKYVISSYDFHQQKRSLHKHLIKLGT